MKKTILYLIEFLAKSPDALGMPYAFMLDDLAVMELHTPTKFSQPQIVALMRHQGLNAPMSFTEGLKALDSTLEQLMPQTLHEAKKTLFTTLLATNFPKKRGFLNHSLDLFLSQLEPVEKSIYDNLLAYVAGLNRGLGFFFCLAKEEPEYFTPEAFVRFSESLHVRLLELIFNEEEQGYLSQGLKELLGVYLSLYGKHLYM
jgi:hypothetical protein